MIAIALAALTGCASTRALCPDEGGTPWREIRTTHFALRTNLSSEGAEQSVVELEQFRSALLSILWPDAQEPPGVLQTIVVRNPSQLAEFASPGIGGYFATGSAGQLLVTSSRTYLAGDYGLDLQIVAHELTHYLSFFAFARQPTWLAEGFATFMETARILDDGRVEVGALSLARLHSAERRRVPVATLWRWNRAPIDDENVNDLYATSWLLVHALINRHPAQFASFLGRLNAGEDPRQAFAAAMPGLTDAQLDRELATYVSSGQYAVVQIPARGEDSAPREKLLSAADAHVIRARLWLRSPGPLAPADAQRRAVDELTQALRHAPKHADALLLQQELSPTSAGAQALIDLLPNDPRAWKEFAQSVRAHPERQIAALDRALALGSEDVEVLIDRAALQPDTAKALDLAERAAALEPFSVPALIGLARANARFGDCKRATQAFDRALERLDERAPESVRTALRNESRGVCRPATPAGG